MGKLKSIFKTGLKSTADLCTLTGLLCIRLRLKHWGQHLRWRSGALHMIYPYAWFATHVPKCRGTLWWWKECVGAENWVHLAAFVTAFGAKQAVNICWWRAASFCGCVKSQTHSCGLSNSSTGWKKGTACEASKNIAGGQCVMDVHCSRRLFHSLISTSVMRTGCTILLHETGRKEMEGMR